MTDKVKQLRTSDYFYDSTNFVKEPQIIAILRSKKDQLEKKYFISELGLFGSYAKKAQRHDSDIDILVDFSKCIDGFTFIRLVHELEDSFPVKIDLVSRKGVKPQYLQYIEKNLIHV